MEDNRKDRIAVTVYNEWDWAHKEREVRHEGFFYDWGSEKDNYINVITNKGEKLRVLQSVVQFDVDTVFKPVTKNRLELNGLNVICNKDLDDEFRGKFIKLYGTKAVIIEGDGTMHVIPVERVQFLFTDEEESIEKGDNSIQKRLKSI